MPHPYFEEINESEIERTDAVKMSQIYETLYRFNVVCKKRGINYCISSGTALGAYRHGGAIPWDDDADVCIHAQQKDDFETLAEEFSQEGLVFFRPANGCYQLWLQDTDINHRGHLDVFVFDWHNKQGEASRFTYAAAPFRALFPNEFFAISEFGQDYNTRELIDAAFTDRNTKMFTAVPFGPKHPIENNQMQVPMLQNQKPAVLRYYGNDCMEYGIHSHSHYSIGCFPIALPNLRSRYRHAITEQTKDVPAVWINWRDSNAVAAARTQETVRQLNTIDQMNRE